MAQPILDGKGEILTVKDAYLYYEVGGRSKGEAVVLIHGFTLDARMWAPQWKAFGKRFRIVRYDVRGFGRSAKAKGPHDPAADLLALLDHLKIDRAHLVGLSMGANIALNFAVRYPDRVLKVVAAAPNIDGFTNYTPELFAAFGQVFGAVAQDGWNENTQNLWLNVPLLRLQTPQAQYQSLIEKMVRSYDGTQFTSPAAAPQYGQPPTLERLGDLKTPLLVIVGEKDEESIRRITDAIVQKAPDAQRLLLAEAGHLSNLDQPRRFNLAVLRFLEKKQ
ncbi:MAG: alpha/beta hydrolase [Saprospiraceae bacterium]|nr:alpha/beta hydrolase [Saprospiraceae bacterium]MDW8228227.1 alpha/beta hydrolase [Saprospiraceae bacterium]